MGRALANLMHDGAIVGVPFVLSQGKGGMLFKTIAQPFFALGGHVSGDSQ